MDKASIIQAIKDNMGKSPEEIYAALDKAGCLSIEPDGDEGGEPEGDEPSFKMGEEMPPPVKGSDKMGDARNKAVGAAAFFNKSKGLN